MSKVVAIMETDFEFRFLRPAGGTWRIKLLAPILLIRGERGHMFLGKRKRVVRTVLSPHLREVWGFVPFRYLILATPGYIVFVDDDLEVDWKSTPEWDGAHAAGRNEFDAVLNRAAAVESGDWNNSDEEKTVKFKRQIGEAIARGLDGNFQRAMEMLDGAEEFRQNSFSAARRREAIADQVKIKDS